VVTISCINVVVVEAQYFRTFLLVVAETQDLKEFVWVVVAAAAKD
jgi:hypothetical protein